MRIEQVALEQLAKRSSCYLLTLGPFLASYKATSTSENACRLSYCVVECYCQHVSGDFQHTPNNTAICDNRGHFVHNIMGL